MATGTAHRRARLSIEIEPELRQKIKDAAEGKNLSVRDYVLTILQRALDEHERTTTDEHDVAWTRLSAGAFARDWDSDEDRVYDRLS